MRKIPNPFSAWGWLIVALVVLALVFAAWWTLSEPGRQKAKAEAARGGQLVAEGGRAASAEALDINAGAAAAARESETLTRRNADDILAAPGADAHAGPVADAGLRGLCRRAAYHDHPRCAGLR